VMSPDPIDSAPADETGEWLYSVQSGAIDQPGLLSVAVTVHQDPGQIARPVSFTLVRWIADPSAVPAETTATDPAASSGSSGSSGGSSGGTSPGGASGT